MPESRYLQELQRRVLIFDGAFGTTVQAMELTAADFGGHEGFNDYLPISRPDIVEQIHTSFMEVGADVLETFTFGGSRLKLGEYGIPDEVYAVNFTAAQLARRVADRYSTPERPCFVAGSMGPTGMLPSTDDPTLGRLGYEDLAAVFAEQAKPLVEGGCDLLIIETTQDLLELKAAIAGIHRYFAEFGRWVPIQAQITLDVTGRMLLGTDIAAAMATLEALPVQVIGINCSTGPTHMREPIRYLCSHSTLPISCIPNAGIPLNQAGVAIYPESPEEMGVLLEEFVKDFGVNVIGGCCGTTPDHIREFVRRVGGLAPTPRQIESEPLLASAMTATALHQEPRPLIVGERVNTNGSKRMKRLVLADDFDGMVTIARQQVEDGAHALDVSVAVTERDDEREQMDALVKKLAASVAVPLIVDSTEPDVLVAAMKKYPGRMVVNSVNMERGREKIDAVLPAVVENGAAVVAMTIDEKDMARTAEHKLAVARRMYEIIVGEYGLAPEALIFDPIVLPVTTGDPSMADYARQTIEGIRAIKQELPGTLTIVGLSNVSFGLTPPAREVLNAVFLYHCVRAGLDLAIMNPKELRPYAEIPESTRQLADDLLLNTHAQALPAYIAFFEAQGGSTGKAQNEAEDPTAGMTTDQKIHWQILHRQKAGIEALLDQAITERQGRFDLTAAAVAETVGKESWRNEAAVDVLNAALLPAMKDVGDRFGAGELILPFVLQSAEVMKKAVAHLEQYLEKQEGYTKGKVVLATVFGDVHDIGKSLVNTILSNNGYTVYDLGKQVPVDTIIAKAIEVKADAIGLSALLVSTSKQMPLCVEELHKRGLQFPVIIGGAAINRQYGRRILFVKNGQPYDSGVFYAKDAFEGLDIMDRLMDPARRHDFVTHVVDEAREVAQATPARATPAPVVTNGTVRSKVKRDVPIPTPPFWGGRELTPIDLNDVYPMMDLNVLFRLQWGGFKKKGADYDRLITDDFEPLLLQLQERAIREQIIRPRIAYGYYPVQADGNDLIIYHPEDQRRELTRMWFPRQQEEEHLCISDYFAPVESGRMDVIGFQVVTAGAYASEYAEQLEKRGEYYDQLMLHGLSVTVAEALAEYANRRIRCELGLTGEAGKRYSWGYPACPNLDDQRQLFKALPADQLIGVQLTEGNQLWPDQSTAAFVVHHPQAKYFHVFKTGGGRLDEIEPQPVGAT
jgi:5-methyltetrahydrofolate--homocysteine methyltransferase